MVLRKCKIVVRYTYRDHREELKDNTEQFVSFPDFRNYWRWQPERTKAINGEEVENARTTTARFSLSFQDDEHTDEINFDRFKPWRRSLKKNEAKVTELLKKTDT